MARRNQLDSECGLKVEQQVLPKYKTLGDFGKLDLSSWEDGLRMGERTKNSVLNMFMSFSATQVDL